MLWWPYGTVAGLPGRSRADPAARRSPARSTTSTRANPSDTKFPAFYDDKVFFADWSRDWIATLTLDGDGKPAAIDRFMPFADFRHPQDMTMGADGSLYVLEWGRDFNFGGQGINPDSGLYRIDFVKGDALPGGGGQVRQGLRAGAARGAASPARARTTPTATT